VVSPHRGYAYLTGGRATLLAAQDEPTAQTLLSAAVAASSDNTLINCITTANHWAIDVGLSARLTIGQEGHLALPEPLPYLASGHFL